MGERGGTLETQKRGGRVEAEVATYKPQGAGRGQLQKLDRNQPHQHLALDLWPEREHGPVTSHHRVWRSVVADLCKAQNLSTPPSPNTQNSMPRQ